jgi:3-hydroxybutyryl-CoA dehydrogenase
VTTPPLEIPRVAVVGAGETGRGWAALAAAAGWQVGVFDIDPRARTEAVDAIAVRARTLVQLRRLPAAVVEHGVKDLEFGKSLLQTVGPADWIIEAITEDLGAKQRVVEAIDDVAKPEAVISSSSSGLTPADIAARAIRRYRVLISHPLNPPEIIPLVEVIRGPETSEQSFDTLRGWLRALGRFPVTLKKQIRGNVATRIAAAVWREAIHLVLQGVIDVEELDTVISLGPALGWTAAGPHLSSQLAAGDRSVRVVLQHLLATFEQVWDDLADWQHLSPEEQRTLEAAVARAYEGRLEEMRPQRDRRIAAILQAIENLPST